MQRNRQRTLQLRFRKCFPHEIGALWTRNILFPLGIQRILFSYVSNMLSHTLIILLSFYFICELPAAFCHWGNNRVHVQNKRCYRVGLCFSLLYYCSFYQWRCFYAAGFFVAAKQWIHRCQFWPPLLLPPILWKRCHLPPPCFQSFWSYASPSIVQAFVITLAEKANKYK